MSSEENNPEAVADLMLAHSNQFKTLETAMKESGLHRNTASAILKRVKARNLPVVHELKNITTKEIMSQLDSKIQMTLDYMDDFVIAGANYRDLTIGLGIMLEKRQLLNGEPTQIMSMEERKNLNELLPYIIAETRRRGITIDQNDGVTTILPETPQIEALSKTARRIKKPEVDKALA